MLLKPNRTKYNKAQRGTLTKVEPSFRSLKFGRFGLVAQECGLLSARQIEATRQVINRYLKRRGKIWIRVFPDFPMTSKPTEVRMGKGKGAVKSWFCRIKRGRILFEVDGASDYSIKEAFYAARKKLPLKTLIFQALWKINKKV